MIIDLNKSGSVDTAGFQVCVMGAGAAGLVLATTLARKGIRTILLESGGSHFEQTTHDLYQGNATGLPYEGLQEGRFRLLGGTTTQWGGQILEIDDFIFKPRAWIPGSGWPIGKTELAPFYRQALALEELGKSPSDAMEIWRAVGLDPPDLGPELTSAFSKWCDVGDLSYKFREAARNTPNLTVLLHANVCRLNAAGDSISSVECRSLTGAKITIAATNFVLSMGAIENCRILLQPSADGSAAPWQRSANVGKHYQDHISSNAAEIVAKTDRLPDTYLDYVSASGFRFHPKMKLREDLQEKLQTLDVYGFALFFDGENDDMALAYETYRWLKTRRYRKISLQRLAHFAANFHKMVWHKFPYSKSLHSAKVQPTRTIKLCVNTEQSPLSDGSITLAAERDALGLQRVNLDWRVSDQEIHSIRTYVSVVTEAFEKQKLGTIVPDERLFRGREIVSNFKDIFHHIGGTRMAVSTADGGVVDPDLKIFGTDNSYVCSSSVFPCSGFVNPTHTIMALAYRLADHLEQRLAAGQFSAGATPSVTASARARA